MLMPLRTLSLMALCLTLVACGTTSALIPAHDTRVMLNAQGYDQIVVQDFVDRTHKKKNKPQSQRRKKAMGLATQRFADKMALEIEKTGVFKQVVREHAENHVANKDYLLVTGEITRYSKGNTLLRVLIGYGIGSAFLDADIKLYDASTHQEIGKFKVDRNSLLWGGILAIAQSADFFIYRASVKIAKEIAAINATEEPAVLATAPL